MSVLIVTNVGDIEVDLHTDECPITTKNFLKLCKIKYYNGCLFHKVERDLLAHTGDPTGTGAGGDSVHKLLHLHHGDQDRSFHDEIRPELRHSKAGTVAMAGASQFYFTLRDGVDHLDDKHTVFGTVVESEGFDTLAKINESDVDDKGRPFKDIRIKHTWILDDPFDDPPRLAELVPENSPVGKPRDEIAEERSEVPLDETVGDPDEQLEEMTCSEDALANNFVIVSCDRCGGGIPGVEPPDNVLYVSKLNPITQDEDLHTTFSRFGTVTSAEIVRDCETGDSLCYAFIEFEAKEACERAYFKMDNCLIDDRKIHVGFTEGVPKLWGQFMQSKRNAKENGCLLKSGAPDHLARDCDQRVEEKNNGTNHVLKDQKTHIGGSNHRSYDLVFDVDGASADLEDRPSAHRKIRKVDDPRSELPHRHGDCNMSRREGTHLDERGSRQGKEDDRGPSGWMRGERHNYSRSGDRSSARYNDSDYSKKQSMSRVTNGVADYRRRPGGGRHESDKFDGQRCHGEEDGPEKSKRHKRRNPEKM